VPQPAKLRPRLLEGIWALGSHKFPAVFVEVITYPIGSMEKWYIYLHEWLIFMIFMGNVG